MIGQDLIFLARWLLATILPALIVIAVIGASHQIGGTAEGHVLLSSLLSFPVLCAVGQWLVTRNTLGRPLLWGVATGGGVLAATVIVALAQRFDVLWRPIVWRLAFWLWDGLGLAAVPSAFVAHAAGGLVFGLTLSGTQALASGFDWYARVHWLAVSTAASLLAAGIVYVFGESGVIGYLLWAPDHEVWRMFLLRAGLAALLGVCFALPTGLCMRGLSRRHRRASDTAVLRRFD